jgi:hypothetical protein
MSRQQSITTEPTITSVEPAITTVEPAITADDPVTANPGVEIFRILRGMGLTYAEVRSKG